jgi:hypothetical protein
MTMILGFVAAEAVTDVLSALPFFFLAALPLSLSVPGV